MDGGQRRRGPAPQKRQAILDAALSVFAESGYIRASIEIIAARADVSTRTIYNHFDNKAALFQTTIEQSASRVAAAQIEIVNRHFGDVAQSRDVADTGSDIEARLIAFAAAWTRPLPDYAEHRALVEQVRAEVGRIPRSAVDAWQQAGPLQVRRALSEVFAAFTEEGILQVEDPNVAAAHFTLLVTVDDPLRPGKKATKREATRIISSGVHAFLYGYADADRVDTYAAAGRRR